MVWLSACNAVLGIKTLEPSSENSSREDSMMAEDRTDAAAGTTGGGSKPSDTAPAAGSGGAPSETKPSRPIGNQSAAGSGGSRPAAAGSGGAAGSSNPNTSPNTSPNNAGAAAPSGGNVTGRVIDHRRRPVPGAGVRIGDKTAQTDMEGRFTLEAPATYDVTLTFNNGSYRKGQIVWQVQGLTRRNPTLQVDRALPVHSATTTFKFQGLKSPLTATQHINLAWASKDGAFSHTDSGENGVEASIDWTGPDASVGVAHALVYETMASSDLPVSYLAYIAQPWTLQQGDTTELSLDLSQSITSAAISGSVSGPNTYRKQHLYLTFDDGTSMPLLDDSSSQNSFSYNVPRVAKSTVAVFAQDGLMFEGSTAAYAGNLAPGQTDVALKLPAMPSLTAPAPGATGITPSTMFSWTTDAAVSVVVVNRDQSEDTAVVVTGKKQIALPFGAGPGLSPGAGVSYAWHVEVHNNHASVDDAAGEMGFLYPAADLRGSGSYADSQSWLFTTGGMQ